MIDPLVSFDWNTLYCRYDGLSNDFKSTNPALRIFNPRPNSLRELYSGLLERISNEKNKPTGIKLDTYEAVLYWKYYSQPRALRICDNLRNHCNRGKLQTELTKLSQSLPQLMSRNKTWILQQIKILDSDILPGIKFDAALPTKTTFLHMIYPDTVPIFDKMVLKAVGAWDNEYATRSRARLGVYVEHAWKLANTYSNSFPAGFKETPLRLIDMALWVIGHG